MGRFKRAGAALIAAPDQARWEGRRDRTLMLLAVQTGLRVSELTALERPANDVGGVSLQVEARTGPRSWDC